MLISMTYSFKMESEASTDLNNLEALTPNHLLLLKSKPFLTSNIFLFTGPIRPRQTRCTNRCSVAGTPGASSTPAYTEPKLAERLLLLAPSNTKQHPGIRA